MSHYTDLGYDAVTSGLRKLQEGALPTDFILESSSGKTWPIHKAILLIHSDVLFRMATSENFTECRTGRAVLKDTIDLSIDVLLYYMYNLTVNLFGVFPICGVIVDLEKTKTEVRFLIGLYQLADAYNVGPVVKEVLHEVALWFNRTDSDIELIEVLLDVVAEFGDLLPKLREKMAEGMAGFLDRKTELNMSKVHAVMKKHADFAVDVLQASVARKRKAEEEPFYHA